MGLYDYINGTQVKCFYDCLYSKSPKRKSSIYFTHGNLITYNTGESVPYKTMYYNYTPNFIVYDYRNKNYPLHIIREGKVYKSVLLADVISEDLLENQMVIDYYGTPLKVATIGDMQKLHCNFQLYDELAAPCIKQIRNIIRLLKMERDLSGKNNTRGKYGQSILEIQQNLESLRQNTIVPYMGAANVRHEFGELLGMYNNCCDRVWCDTQDREAVETLADCKAYIKEYVANHPHCLDDFLAWFDMPESEEAIRNLYEDALADLKSTLKQFGGNNETN